MKLNQQKSIGKSPHVPNIYISLLLLAALCISKTSPLQFGSVLCPLWTKHEKICKQRQTALDADVFWVPKYFWCFKFCKLTVLKLRQSENWKQRRVNHAHKHTKPQLSNKIKSPNICWKNYFQLMLALRQRGAASLYCSCLLKLHFCVCFSWSMKPSQLGLALVAAGTAAFQRRNPVNWPIWDVSLAFLLSSCTAGLQHRELLHGRRSPAPGCSRCRIRSLLVRLCSSPAAPPFLPWHKPQQLGFCRATSLGGRRSKSL